MCPDITEIFDIAIELCAVDANCTDGQLCCPSGELGKQCRDPVTYDPTGGMTGPVVEDGK